MGVNLVNEINNDIILGGEGDKKAQKYLFFALDEIEYGVDISIVDEIITMTPVSPIPSTKPFCKGVINIRGSIVPIIDMRIKLGKPEIEYDDAACIIIFMLEGEKVGAIVEKVLNGDEIADIMLLDSPAKSDTTGYRSVSSKIVANSGGVKQILDVGKVFDIEMVL